jgi:hypothetical protein
MYIIFNRKEERWEADRGQVVISEQVVWEWVLSGMCPLVLRVWGDGWREGCVQRPNS